MALNPHRWSSIGLCGVLPVGSGRASSSDEESVASSSLMLVMEWSSGASPSIMRDPNGSGPFFDPAVPVHALSCFNCIIVPYSGEGGLILMDDP